MSKSFRDYRESRALPRRGQNAHSSFKADAATEQFTGQSLLVDAPTRGLSIMNVLGGEGIISTVHSARISTPGSENVTGCRINGAAARGTAHQRQIAEIKWKITRCHPMR